MNSLEDFIKFIKREYKSKPIFVSIAPGRADFLNTHQDYKGLPVVPVAITLRTYVALIEFSDRILVESLNLKELGEEYRDEFNLSPTLVEGSFFGNYLRACIISLLKRGLKLRKGFHAVIWSQVPIGAGLGSSGALEVSFITLLNGILSSNLTPMDIAELAYIAEHDIMGIPCGRLDQYASSFGEIIVLYPNPPVKVEKIHAKLTLAIIDSGIKHATANIHPKRQAELNLALKKLRTLDLPPQLQMKLGETYSETAWNEIKFEEIQKFLEYLDEKLANRIEFTLRMNELTRVAIKILKKESLDTNDVKILRRENISIQGNSLQILADIVNKQHELLRDLYDVSLPELEEIRKHALEAGAYAVKISGAGLGGCLLALVNEKKFEDVKKACLKAGAKRVWLCSVSEGAKVLRLK